MTPEQHAAYLKLLFATTTTVHAIAAAAGAPQASTERRDRLATIYRAHTPAKAVG